MVKDSELPLQEASISGQGSDSSQKKSFILWERFGWCLWIIVLGCQPLRKLEA